MSTTNVELKDTLIFHVGNLFDRLNRAEFALEQVRMGLLNCDDPAKVKAIFDTYWEDES